VPIVLLDRTPHHRGRMHFPQASTERLSGLLEPRLCTGSTRLSEAARHRPYQLVLLYEIEKAACGCVGPHRSTDAALRRAGLALVPALRRLAHAGQRPPREPSHALTAAPHVGSYTTCGRVKLNPRPRRSRLHPLPRSPRSRNNRPSVAPRASAAANEENRQEVYSLGLAVSKHSDGLRRHRNPRTRCGARGSRCFCC